MALVLDGNAIGADINGHCISNSRFADDNLRASEAAGMQGI